MVPCETFLVKQGYFDIFFPTGERFRDFYDLSPTSNAMAMAMAMAMAIAGLGLGIPSDFGCLFCWIYVFDLLSDATHNQTLNSSATLTR
jgi:hypothetical protein